MLIKFFEKLEKSKWVPWVGTAPFVLGPIAIMLGGEVARGIGLLAFFASAWVGIVLGGKFALFLCTHVFETSEDNGKRLTAAFSAFGFLFIPVVVALIANSNLGTDIGTKSLTAHFVWACIGGAIFYCVSPTDSEQDTSTRVQFRLA